MFIESTNDKGELLESNFWQTDYAANSYRYLSCDSGVIRILLPNSCRLDLTEMRAAKYVIGSVSTLAGSPAIELLFEDSSDTPFQLTLGRGSFDMLPSVATGWKLAVYTEGPTKELVFQDVRLRRVPRLPWLKPWTN